MTCSDVDARDFVAEYAHGRLSEADRDAFEEHFLGCPSCFDALQNYRVLHAALPHAAPAGASARRARSLWLGLAAAAALMLVVAATLMSRPSATRPAVQTPPPVAGTVPLPSPAAPPAAAAEPASPASPDRAERILLLARVEPPRYQPPALRGSEDEARRRFEAAMQKYSAGDFAGAATALRSEVRAGVSTAGVLFYLAIADLQSGATEDAVSGLEQVAKMQDLLFEEDARFFLAKALLRQGHVARAREEIAGVIALEGDRETESRRLLAAIDQLPPS